MAGELTQLRAWHKSQPLINCRMSDLEHLLFAVVMTDVIIERMMGNGKAV